MPNKYNYQYSFIEVSVRYQIINNFIVRNLFKFLLSKLVWYKYLIVFEI